MATEPHTEDGSGQPDNDAIAAARRKEEGYVGPHELAEMAAKERIEKDLQRAIAILDRGYDPWEAMAQDDMERERLGNER